MSVQLKTYRRYGDPATQSLYDQWRASPPEDGPARDAYAAGRAGSGLRNPHPRGSVSFVAYAAGLDNYRENLARTDDVSMNYKPTSIRVRPDTALARELERRKGTLHKRLEAMAEDVELLRAANEELERDRAWRLGDASS